MSSEDPGKEVETDENDRRDRSPGRAPGGIVRWFFSFDGWRLVDEEDEFVLA